MCPPLPAQTWEGQAEPRLLGSSRSAHEGLMGRQSSPLPLTRRADGLAGGLWSPCNPCHPHGGLPGPTTWAHTLTRGFISPQARVSSSHGKQSIEEEEVFGALTDCEERVSGSRR